MHVMEMAELGNIIENCFFEEILNQFDQLIEVFTFNGEFFRILASQQIDVVSLYAIRCCGESKEFTMS